MVTKCKSKLEQFIYAINTLFFQSQWCGNEVRTPDLLSRLHTFQFFTLPLTGFPLSCLEFTTAGIHASLHLFKLFVPYFVHTCPVGPL